jgi:hemerythrin-like domain-containing protein
VTTSIPGFSAPAAVTGSPLAMLSACHHRIEAQCATLRCLVSHLLARGVDDEARAATNKLIAFFDTATMQHHADEEDDLFPALIESMAGSDAICLRQMIDGLTADHRTLEACWQHLRGVLERIAAGECVPLVADEVEVLAACHERHMEREERELLPMAARLLSDEDLARLEHAMRGRR